jgi:hypothetical protein
VGSGVIINGVPELVPGLQITNWLDNSVLRLREGEDVKPRRTSWIRQVVLHTTKGIPGGDDQRKQVFKDGFGPFANAGEGCTRWWSKSPEAAGAHLIVDHDGQVYCCADLATEAAQHARHANQTSVGVEIYQGKDAEMYLGQLDRVVRLVDFLTRRFRIQRQIPHKYIGAVHRLESSTEIDDVVGVFGHRDLTKSRGFGDPGDKIINMLGMAGYEPMDFDQRKDMEEWRRRQSKLGMPKVDGIPGPATCDALAAAGRPGEGRGRPHGLWLTRPGDQATLPGLV